MSHHAPNAGNQAALAPADLATAYRAIIDAIDRIVETYYYQGRFDEALQLLDSSQQIARQKEVSREDQVKVTVTKGKLLARKSFLSNDGYDAALSVLAVARETAASLNHKPLLATALTFAGLVTYGKTFNTGKGDYASAQDYFEQALHLRKELDDQRGIAESLIYTGIVHERQGDENTAVDHYQKALTIADKNNLKLEKSYALRHLAFLRQAHEDLDGALEYFKQSLALREEIGFKVYLPLSFLSVGHVYYEKGALEDALAYYRQSYTLAQELEARRVVALCALLMGELYQDQEKFEKALASFKEAQTTAVAIGYTKGATNAAAKIAEIEKKGVAA